MGGLLALTVMGRFRPLAGRQVDSRAMGPWIEIGVGPGLTGTLVRGVGEAALGWNFGWGGWIFGPSARYLHVLQPHSALDSSDAQVALLGVEIVMRDSHRPAPIVAPPVAAVVVEKPKVLDRDGDGIPDDVDKCPNEPEDKDGFEDDDGCPDLDNDKDGIPDKQDKCPNQPETLNGYRDDDGCPDPGAEWVVLRSDKIDIIERITFLPGQTTLSPVGLSVVKLVAMVMRGHTELARVRIDVRADGVGEETMRGRAQEVVKTLAAHGVDAKRLKLGNVSSGSSRVQFIIESRVVPKSNKTLFPGMPPPAPQDAPQVIPPETPAPQAP